MRCIPEKKHLSYYQFPAFNNGHLSGMATFLHPQGGRFEYRATVLA